MGNVCLLERDELKESSTYFGLRLKEDEIPQLDFNINHLDNPAILLSSPPNAENSILERCEMNKMSTTVAETEKALGSLFVKTSNFHIDTSIVIEGPFKFSDGSTYLGTLKNNQPHGYGRFITSHGEIFEGQFMLGQRHGYGRLIKNDGTYFEGNFIKGIPEEGKLAVPTNQNGCYDGSLSSNNFEGVGIHIEKEGILYQGEFKGSKRSGLGSYVYKDELIYQGEFLNNLMHGYGIACSKLNSRRAAIQKRRDLQRRS